MGPTEREWERLREAWNGYSALVTSWLEISDDPDADPALVDALVHEVIAGHNAWSERLGKMIDATHRH